MRRGTRAAFDQRYHSFARRESLLEPRIRGLKMASLRRVLGPVLPADRSATILDIGCGEGTLLRLLVDEGYRELAAFDFSPENVALCHDQGFAFVRRHDAIDLGSFEPGRAFDLILCMDVLEHVRKDDALPFLEAARRRLRPAGSLVIQTPNMGSVTAQLHRHADLTHEWGVTERSVVDLLVAAAFDREQVTVGPAWSAATARGRLREWYLRVLHRIIFLAEGSNRPRIPTPNLLVEARVR